MTTAYLASCYGYILEPQILQSKAGFYIGTVDALNEPVSRESEEYYLTYGDASEALYRQEWTQRPDC